jgi:hypothetical protein
MIADHWRAAVRPPKDGRLRDIIWPASFPNAPRARVPAHALAALVVFTSLCEAFSGFYWADDDQVDHRVEALIGSFLQMGMPLLLMSAALAGALRDWRKVPYWFLTAAAWAASVLMTPLLLLFTWLTNDNDYCTANLPVHPLQLYVVPLCLLAALATGSSAGWITWVLSHRRARPVVLYAVWLATVAAAVVLILALPLHTAQTCGPTGMG